MDDEIFLSREVLQRWLETLPEDGRVTTVEETFSLLLPSEPESVDILASDVGALLTAEWRVLQTCLAAGDVAAQARLALQESAKHYLHRRLGDPNAPLATIIPPTVAAELGATLPEPFDAHWPQIEHRPVALHRNVVFWLAILLWLFAVVGAWRLTEVELGGRLLLVILASTFLWFCISIATSEPAWPKKLTTIETLIAHLAQGVEARHAQLKALREQLQ